MTENDISLHIVRAATEVHRTLGGPGLLESIYEEALVLELEGRGLRVARQVARPAKYKTWLLHAPIRIDLLVDDCVIVECKAVAQHHAIFQAQALTYLRICNLRLALVINFGVPLLKHGIKRVVNQLDEPR